MHVSRRTLIAAGIAALTMPSWASAAAATSFTEGKPIKLVVPYTPGGGTDTVARFIGNKIALDTKWTIVIDNRPGAGGNIGMDAVAKSKPDGLTIGMGQTSNLAINPALMPKMPFNARDDFAPIAIVASLPVVLVVRSDSPFQNLQDVIKAAKAKPGDLKQALAGPGTVGHLAGELLAYQAQFQVLNVPYKGAAPALTDLMAGSTDFMFSTPQSILEMLKGKRLRALAVSSAERLSILPDVPTVAEQGFAGFEAVDWKALVAPAKTPADVIAAMNQATQDVLKRKETVELLEKEGSKPILGSPEKAKAYIQAEQVKWAKLIKDANIKFD